MHYISNIAAAAALVSAAMAGDAPVVQGDQTAVSYLATIPQTGANSVYGSVSGAAAPGGVGTNFEVNLYNLPGSGSLSYGLYTGKVHNGDCSTAGAILDPYGGVTGSQCASNPASCQVGDLSDKHGDAKILSGGAGTGYFAANYPDKYVSMTPGSKAFFGDGSVVISDANGAQIACANFVNELQKSVNATRHKHGHGHGSSSSSTSAPSQTSKSGTGSSGSQSSSSSTGGASFRTAAPIVGVLGMAALLL